MLDKILNHFSGLTSIDFNIFDVDLKDFQDYSRTFCHSCPKKCDYNNLHLYGCYESSRLDNKYIYYCPMELVFISIPIFSDYNILKNGLIAGPILMGEMPEDSNNISLPYLETSKVNDLTEILSALFSTREPETHTESSNDFISAVYKELELLPDHETYPLEIEKKLQSAIINGNSDRAREYLNKLLGEIFFRSKGDFNIIKTRALELLVLLSRSAIDAGADSEQIFYLNNSYIREVDKYDTLEKLSFWLSSAINKFISYVFEFGDLKHSLTLHKIIGYIKSNYMNKITLDEMARHVYLSKSHLSKIFNEEMNMSFSSFVNKVRIDNSKQLLLDSSLSIADIANMCGFEDQSYFTKQFKIATGFSPKKFREKHGAI